MSVGTNPTSRSTITQSPLPSDGNKYKLLEKILGEGSFGRVKLAIHMKTGKQVAFKMINKSKLDVAGVCKVLREIAIMKLLNHPNIIKLLQVIHTETFIYIVMEYVSGGEVYDYLAHHGRMREEVARSKFRQIISAVHYCHEKSIVHRDLKLENVLLDEAMNIKLIDFGFSSKFTPGVRMDTFCGSLSYSAPELFLAQKYDGPKVDVWSLGVMLFVMATGSLPFGGSKASALQVKQLASKGNFSIPFYVSQDLRNLLAKMIVVDPQRRATLETVMKDNVEL